MRKEDKTKYDYKRIEIYLKPKDAALFERKAKRYRYMSCMIRDAVKQFNDLVTKGKLEALWYGNGYKITAEAINQFLQNSMLLN